MLFAVANWTWVACNISLSSFLSSPLIGHNSRGHSDSHRGAVSAVLALYHVSTSVKLAESAECSKFVTFPAAGKNSGSECALGSEDGDALSISASCPGGSQSQHWAASLCKWSSSSLSGGDCNLFRELSCWMLSKSGVNKLRMLKKVWARKC